METWRGLKILRSSRSRWVAAHHHIKISLWSKQYKVKGLARLKQKVADPPRAPVHVCDIYYETGEKSFDMPVKFT